MQTSYTFGPYAVLKLRVHYDVHYGWYVYNLAKYELISKHKSESEAQAAAFSLKVMDDLDAARVNK